MSKQIELILGQTDQYLFGWTEDNSQAILKMIGCSGSNRK